MEIIKVEGLWYCDYIEYYILGKVRQFCSAARVTLEQGKSYCIDSRLISGGWAISWAITGNIKPSKQPVQGKIYFDDKEMSHKELKKLCCSVGLTGYEGTFHEKKTVRKLLTKSIANNPEINSIEELKEPFILQEGRFDRSIRAYSNERWRATMAMAYGAGKKVFGFPWMIPEYLYDYKDAWMKDVFNFLISKGCTIIIPTIYNDSLSELFDKVIRFNMPGGILHGSPIEIVDV